MVLHVSNMSCRLLLPAPSVASATFTPWSKRARIGAIPDAKYMLETGQWTTDAPRSAMSWISVSSSHTECANWTSGPNTPRESNHGTWRNPRSLRFISTSISVSAQWVWM